MIKKLSFMALLLFIIGVLGSAATYGSMYKKTAINEVKQLENENIKFIDINLDSEDVELIPVSSIDEARVELVGEGLENIVKDFSVTEAGETLTVTLKSENQKWFSFDFYFPALTLKIFVPEKIYEDIQIKGFSSDILVQELDAKQIEISTDSGDVEVKNSHFEEMTVRTFSGDIDMESVKGVIKTVTDSGDLKVLNAPVKSFDAASFSGDIKLEQIEGTVSTKTDSGDVFITTSEITQPIFGRTFSGDITIRSEEPTNIKFDVRTFSGDVNLFDKYKNNAKVGKGTILIQLETDSGDITIRR